MKMHQIPSIHDLVMRWRQHDVNKVASVEGPTKPDERPPPMATPPSSVRFKSASKRSVQIQETPRADKGKGRSVESDPGPGAPSLPSPPPSPRINLRPRPANRCSSGTPTSHSQVGEIVTRYGNVSVEETFECVDAVDPVRLLSLSRRNLLADARARGGNALADEVWEYTVSKRGKSGYVVKIEYTASAVLAKGEGSVDPQKPVAIGIARTKGINGLMTVTSRH